MQFDLIVVLWQQFGDSNHYSALGQNGTIYKGFAGMLSYKDIGVRSAQFLYIVPCTVGPGFAEKDLMMIGDRNMKAIREYLKHKPCLRGQILDRGELKRVAQACGLSPQQARLELKELGFILTQNNHGLTIWKKLEKIP